MTKLCIQKEEASTAKQTARRLRRRNDNGRTNHRSRCHEADSDTLQAAGKRRYRHEGAVQAQVERSDSCAVPAASVVMEHVVAWEVAKAFMEKFGGDSMEEIRANLQQISETSGDVLKMKRLNVDLGERSYPILIGRALFADAGIFCGTVEDSARKSAHRHR